MVIVESRTDRKCNTESFQSVLHRLKDVAKSFGVLKKQALELPKFVRSMVEDAAVKVCSE